MKHKSKPALSPDLSTECVVPEAKQLRPSVGEVTESAVTGVKSAFEMMISALDGCKGGQSVVEGPAIFHGQDHNRAEVVVHRGIEIEDHSMAGGAQHEEWKSFINGFKPQPNQAENVAVSAMLYIATCIIIYVHIGETIDRYQNLQHKKCVSNYTPFTLSCHRALR